MTIKLDKIVENPIHQDSKIFGGFSESRVREKDTAAIMWICESKDRISAWNLAISEVCEAIKTENGDLSSLWVLVADSVWQKDTPLMRKKVAVRRAFNGVECKKCINRYTVNSDGSLKHFSAFQPRDLTKLVTDTSSVYGYDVYIINIKDEHELERILEEGWDTNLPLDERLLTKVINEGGTLVRLFGKFDDIESGLMAFHKS